MEKPLTGKQVFLAFAAFFGLVFAANFVFVYLAMDSWTGLQTEQAYEKGLAYNEALAQQKAVEALGWQGELTFVSEAENLGRLAFTFQDREGTDLQAAEVKAVLIRPTHEGHDFSVILPEVRPGSYEKAVTFPLAGLWDAQIRARLDGQEYRLQRRVYVRQ